MFGSLTRRARTTALLLFSLLALLPKQVQAQSIVGTWTSGSQNFSFQADGQWSATYSGALGLDSACKIGYVGVGEA
jgi:hypothetical protein